MRGYPAESVEEYATVIPESTRGAFGIVRGYLRDAIPGVGEHIGYGIPIFDYRGKGLVGLSVAQAGHLSLHVMSPPTAKALTSEITEGRWSGATLQFAPDAPLSEAAVRLIVDRRISETDAAR